VINGALTRLGMNLTHPSLVLSLFIRELGGSNTLIGMLPAIRFGGWFLPQFLVSGWIQPRRRKVPIAVALEVFRAITYTTLGFLTHFLGRSHPDLLLALFFVLFALTRFTAGTGALARMDVIGKVVPPERRTAFFAVRGFWGGWLVFGSGFLVSFVLDEGRGQTFPHSFTLLFALSALSFVFALITFSRMREPEGPGGRPRRSLREQLARAPKLVRQDAALKQYLWVRVLLDMRRLSCAFYPVFALEILGAPDSMVGVYIVMMTLAQILSNPLWQWVSRVRGRGFLLQTVALLSVLEPVLALGLPWLIRLGGGEVGVGFLWPAYLFGAVYLVAGVSMSGRSIGFQSMLLDLAPDEERASYIGFVNTTLGFVNFLPIAAGAVADAVGYEPVFIFATALLLVGFVVTWVWRVGD
jgi:hypothetical protein